MTSCESQSCLICDKEAIIVYLNCGHLTLCKECAWLRRKKRLRNCVLCGEETFRVYELKRKISGEKFGVLNLYFYIEHLL
jgi:hypothetical protein